MARLHGRNGRIYIGIASDTAAAEPLPFVATWSIAFSTDNAEVTALGDTVKTYVAGLPDATGSLTNCWSARSPKGSRSTTSAGTRRASTRRTWSQ